MLPLPSSFIYIMKKLFPLQTDTAIYCVYFKLSKSFP